MHPAVAPGSRIAGILIISIINADRAPAPPAFTTTVRSALMEVNGGRRRQMVVCGDQGTIAIRPLEPPQLSLTLAKPQGNFSAGTHSVPLPKLGGRYDGDFKDLAQIIRGEKRPDYSVQHDLAVQEAVLLASGLPTQ